METINYDFSGLENAVNFIKQNPTPSNLESLKREINMFWKDRSCLELIYTVNMDKLFFGLITIPMMNEIDDDKVRKILTTNDVCVVKSYSVELDSKLFELGLTAREITSVLLYQIGGIINGGAIDAMRICMDTYCTNTGANLPSLTYDSRKFLKFGIAQSIRKFNDIFDITDENYISPEYIVRFGYNKELESAVKRIIRKEGIIRVVENKFIALQWCIRLQQELKYRKLNSIRAINNLLEFTGSELEKSWLIYLKRMLMNDSTIYEQLTVNESFIDKLLDKGSDAYKSFKYKGMRGLEDDLYEYAMRVENIDDEEESLQILRCINLRIAMIDDYILQEGKHINEADRNRWFDLKSKYASLRDKLANKKTYKDKYYGLFVKTPVVSSRYEV